MARVRLRLAQAAEIRNRLQEDEVSELGLHTGHAHET